MYPIARLIFKFIYPQPLVVGMPFFGIITIHATATCTRINPTIHMYRMAATNQKFQPN